jgi:hypothetical protein
VFSTSSSSSAENKVTDRYNNSNNKRRKITITDHYRASNNDSLPSTMALCFAVHSLPQTLTRSPLFRQLVQEIRDSSCPIPSIPSLIHAQESVYVHPSKAIYAGETLLELR